ncbi:MULTISPECIES: hypothetical protein [Stenotrophomonas]|jgi:hypothetical protein|uniref:hypothetical protein n=1 Tax=Stenotrophomonas TaxID=40323 RepID=UPI00201CF112|nr:MULTISPECIES: hypothetical protein [Stenotrophomonas]MBN5024925.1 hypothetical protein [Stenotrophomonas maltophilia]MDH1274803.1 hypothetical protein [Stenotrophomonas sp. GD03937]MDH1486273.1 hypothetical protein [Stenotrophomonas sp. GD03712]UQY96358.1 hypothetical protein LZ605_03080 [Stenotrophomonas maltophilia]WON67004.1 hypothetical protein RWT08_12315 [Stenotrophomonas maltophilia]
MDVRVWSAMAVVVLAGCSGSQAGSVDEAEVPGAAAVRSQSVAASDAGSPRAATATATAGATAAHGYANVEGHFLEGERLLMADGGVSAQKSEAVLGSDKAFAQAIGQFERDASSRPEVQDLTGLYKAAATRLIGRDGTLVSFACGYSLCVGEIRSRTEEDFSAWSEAFGMDKASPVYSLTTAPMTWGRDQHGGRFVFSVDPAANAITGQ